MELGVKHIRLYWAIYGINEWKSKITIRAVGSTGVSFLSYLITSSVCVDLPNRSPPTAFLNLHLKVKRFMNYLFLSDLFFFLAR